MIKEAYIQGYLDKEAILMRHSAPQVQGTGSAATTANTAELEKKRKALLMQNKRLSGGQLEATLASGPQPGVKQWVTNPVETGESKVKQMAEVEKRKIGEQIDQKAGAFKKSMGGMGLMAMLPMAAMSFANMRNTGNIAKSLQNRKQQFMQGPAARQMNQRRPQVAMRRGF
jgi:hypothetical protein